MSYEATSKVVFCLRGHIGGLEQVYPLLPGINRLGSLIDNEVVLPANGVSRLHARLSVAGGELEIEDLASKNGTFVAGRRVDRVRIAAGQVVRFGPVALVFQEFHRDDAELAITFESAIADQTGTVPIVRSPVAGIGGSVPRRWLRLAELFHARLYSKPETDLGAALSLLVEKLHLEGTAVFEIPEDQYPIVLAASGRVSRAATDGPRRLCAGSSTSPRRGIDFKTTDSTTPPTTLATLTSAGSDPLVLVLWGSFPARTESEQLLRVLVRMLVPCRPRSESSGEHAPEGEQMVQHPGLVFPPDYVHAQSAVMAKIYRLMQTLAMGDLPILIIGETGAGKEYLAQIIHGSSPRRHGPFVAINCAAIPAELLEAELFGIGEGVATGVSAKEGRLQVASGGTIFLDEIGDMSADLQAKLLRALQEKEVHPVGRDAVPIDVRVLAATNQDLPKRIEEGSFRSDLFYRLAGYVLELPPLRQRPEDIPALVEHFLRATAKELRRPIRGLTVRALRMLCTFPWPGNVRELANEVRRAVYLCPENRTVESSILSQAIREKEPAEPVPEASAGAGPETAEGNRAHFAPGLDSLNLEQLESRAVVEALRRSGNNQVQAAKLLGISRQSLRRRMTRLGILKPRR